MVLESSMSATELDNMLHSCIHYDIFFRITTISMEKGQTNKTCYLTPTPGALSSPYYARSLVCCMNIPAIEMRRNSQLLATYKSFSVIGSAKVLPFISYQIHYAFNCAMFQFWTTPRLIGHDHIVCVGLKFGQFLQLHICIKILKVS